MKTNPTVLLLLLALIGTSCLGGIGWVGFMVTLRSLAEKTRDEVLTTIPVVIVARDLPAGTILDDPDTQLVLKPFLRDTVPSGAVSNVEDLRGKTLGRTLNRGAACTVSDLAKSAPLVDLAPGMRAVTIRVPLEQAVGGFVKPGSRVEIRVTTPDPTNAQRTLSTVVASDIVVLVVDVSRDGAPAVTVALSAADAQAVAAAEAKGPLTITLLRPKAAD